MVEQLARNRGKFILSINDGPEIREAFTASRLEDATLKYSVSSGDTTDAAELVITEFKPRVSLL